MVGDPVKMLVGEAVGLVVGVAPSSLMMASQAGSSATVRVRQRHSGPMYLLMYLFSLKRGSASTQYEPG